MNTTIIPRFIVRLFAQEIERIHNKLLEQISKDYNLDFDELKKKYTSNIDVSKEKIQIIKKRDYNVNLKDDKRCTALNSKHQRCQRSKGSHDLFCPIHQKNNKYGVVGDTTKPNPKKWNKLY